MIFRAWASTLFSAIKCLVCYIAITLSLSSDSFAADQVDQQATEIYSSVMSPYCPGITLSSCASGDATLLRTDIHTWLQEGVPVEEIKNRLVARFGEGVFGMPSNSGFGLVAWVAPILAVILGLTAILLFMRRSGRPALAEFNTPQGISPEMATRVQAEFKDYLRNRPEKEN